MHHGQREAEVSLIAEGLARTVITKHWMNNVELLLA